VENGFVHPTHADDEAVVMDGVPQHPAKPTSQNRDVGHPVEEVKA
jgi:hypothetical protein